MYKGIILSCAACSVLFAQSATLETITVEWEKAVESTQKELGDYEVKTTKQMDLAEIISSKIPSVNHIRNSGVGSDISLRGFERDNINVTIDDVKVCGACPNRMDPPAMHISGDQIKTIEIQEGPFDVANFGAMGGSINVKTQSPKKEAGGSLGIHAGSFGYKKISATATGGNDTVQILVGFSKEESDQYKDGDGNTLVEQIDSIAKVDATKYQDTYKDLKAFERKSFWSKLNFDLADNQALKLSLYKDDADDVLYPTYGMDAQIDETTMYSIEYNAKNLSNYSKELSIKYYNSEVKHEMGTEFRDYTADQNSDGTPDSSFRTHAVDSEIAGIKLQNKTDHYTYGLDTSKRTWYGNCLAEPTRTLLQVKIPDVETKNVALFGKTNHNFGNITLNTGIRIDRTKVNANEDVLASGGTAGGSLPGPVSSHYNNKTDKKFNDISVNATLSYDLGDDSSVFASLGQATRVPDAKEMYAIWYGKDNNVGDAYWKIMGNPDLKSTKNRELDIGYKTVVGDSAFKAKAFYSDLKDFIYAHKITTNATKPNKTLTYDNIDAKIYGLELSFNHAITDSLFFDASMAYQRGKKDEALAGQTNKNLAGIAPLKGRFALELDQGNYFALAEIIAANKQTIDSDNGEEDIGGYAVMNLKGGYSFSDSLELNAGINNIFDKTYAVNNSYAGRGLIGSTGDPMILNEPGRSFYINLKYTF